jgi:hypothetical protein
MIPAKGHIIWDSHLRLAIQPGFSGEIGIHFLKNINKIF